MYAREAEALTKLQSSFLKTLRDRGFLHQFTSITDLDNKLMENADASPKSAYLGFDATADSLHVGSLLQIMILRTCKMVAIVPLFLLEVERVKWETQRAKMKAASCWMKLSFKGTLKVSPEYFQSFSTLFQRTAVF